MCQLRMDRQKGHKAPGFLHGPFAYMASMLKYDHDTGYLGSYSMCGLIAICVWFAQELRKEIW